MTVSNLLDKVVEGIRSRGVEPYWINYELTDDSKRTQETPDKTIHVKETCRINHKDLENVTVTIEVTTWKTDAYGWRLGKDVKIKVPKNASDKVINNRITKALEYYNQ